MTIQPIGAAGASPIAKAAATQAVQSIGSAMIETLERMAENGTSVQQGEALRALDRAKDTEHQPDKC